MFDNFDNDTYEKARKLSLRFCAALSIILYLQVDISNLDIFGIKLETDKKHLIYVSIAMWVYTSIIFWWFAYKKLKMQKLLGTKYAFAEASKRKLNRKKQGLFNPDRHLPKRQYDTATDKDAHEQQIAEQEFEKLKERNILSLSWKQFRFIEIFPTLLMQLVSGLLLIKSLYC